MSNVFASNSVEALGNTGAVYRIVCPPENELLVAQGTQRPGRMLRDLIETQDRHAGGSNTTIILDVVGGAVPAYVEEAIDSLNGFAAGVIVRCCGATTHDANSTLPAGLCAKVKKANRQGVIWHPVLQQQVQAK